jgi:hypothetical protein
MFVNTSSIPHPVVYIRREACVYVPRVYVCMQAAVWLLHSPHGSAAISNDDGCVRHVLFG